MEKAPFRKLSSEISNPQAEFCSKFFLEQILQYIIVVGYPPQALGKCASNSILISAASFQVKFPRGQYIYISSILSTSSWTRSVQLPSIDLAEDSVLHLYFDSHISKSVWDEIHNWLGMRKNKRSPPTTILKAFQILYSGNSTLARMRLMALAATVYHVWNLHNRVMFENMQPYTKT